MLKLSVKGMFADALTVVTGSTPTHSKQTYDRHRRVNLMKPEKTRILVLGLFFLALIVFAMVYRPTNAMSDPNNQNGTVAPAVSR